MEWSAVSLEQIVVLVIGLLGMPLTQWLKLKLGWEDLYVRILVIAVSVVLAFGNLFLMGSLTWEMLTLQNFANVFGLIYTAAAIWYGMLKEVRKARE